MPQIVLILVKTKRAGKLVMEVASARVLVQRLAWGGAHLIVDESSSDVIVSRLLGVSVENGRTRAVLDGDGVEIGALVLLVILS